MAASILQVSGKSDKEKVYYERLGVNVSGLVTNCAKVRTVEELIGLMLYIVEDC